MIKKFKTPTKYFSPLRYPGGKARYATLFENIFYVNRIMGYDFMEPYAGGAGGGLVMLNRKYINRLHLNDKDHNIYSFWDTLINGNAKRFVSDMISWRLSKKAYLRNLEFLKTPFKNSRQNKYARALALLYMNRTSWSGILGSKYIGSVQCNKHLLAHKINQILKFKKRMSVDSLNSVDYLTRFLNSKQKDVFIYLDPPYEIKNRAVYHEHCVDHYRDLIPLLKGIKGPWLMSLNNSKLNRSIFKIFRQKIISVSFHMTRKKTTELLIYSKNLKGVKL